MGNWIYPCSTHDQEFHSPQIPELGQKLDAGPVELRQITHAIQTIIKDAADR